MNNRSKNFIELFEGLTEQTNNSENIDAFLNIVPKLSSGILFRQYIIFHKNDIADVINHKISEVSSIYKKFSSSTFVGFDFKNKKKDILEKGYIGILPGSSPNISRLISISDSDFWNIVVRRLIKKFYPEAIPIFFRQIEIEKALFHLEKGLGFQYRINIADVTAKEERSFMANSNIKKYDTQRWWTDLPISEVFEQARLRGQWFTGLRFNIQRRIGDSDKYVTQGSVRLNKFGELNYDSFYHEINSYLLNKLETYAHKRLTTLDGRSLREQNYRPVLPIEIAFEDEIFSDLEEVRRFGRVISKYPNSTKVVFHANPYYHASIADFLDGSSFDVWVLSNNKIILIPQAKSSVQAFERFINHISANFSEGVVDEYQR
jgi:hypothetical protein